MISAVEAKVLAEQAKIVKPIFMMTEVLNQIANSAHNANTALAFDASSDLAKATMNNLSRLVMLGFNVFEENNQVVIDWSNPEAEVTSEDFA